MTESQNHQFKRHNSKGIYLLILCQPLTPGLPRCIPGYS